MKKKKPKAAKSPRSQLLPDATKTTSIVFRCEVNPEKHSKEKLYSLDTWKTPQHGISISELTRAQLVIIRNRISKFLEEGTTDEQ